jgi:hypothetical protein
VRAGLQCFCWSGGGVGHGDDGGGDAGDGVLRAGVREGRGGLGLAGAVPAAIDNGPGSSDFAGDGLVAGVPEADRGQDRADGAGEGQVAGPDPEPGAEPLISAVRGGALLVFQP